MNIAGSFFFVSSFKELYVEDYYTINWPAQRSNIAKVDLYTPHSWLYNLAFGFLDIYERFHIAKERQRALDECLDHIEADDEFTQCISIGPVSKVSVIQKSSNSLFLF